MPYDEIVRHRRALHKIPELMYDLPKTQAYVLDALEGLSCAVEAVAETGVLAYFDAGKAETVAFRADMDALPVAEMAQHDYRSEHPGQMHACGHDGHMAILLAFAAWVDRNIDSLPRNVLLMFQPAEESGAGGERVVESGCLERRCVTRAFAIHVDPMLPVGTIASRPGALMARASEIHLIVEGKAGHAAVPGAGADALAAAVDFVSGAYRAQAEWAGDAPHRLKFCQFQSGNSTNVIADRAHIKGSLRTFSDADFHALRASMQALAADAARAQGVICHLDIHDGYPALVNDAALLETAAAHLPIERIPESSFLGEDFSFIARRVPAVMFRLGLGTDIPLHAATFDFDERALVPGVHLFQTLAKMEA